MKCSHKIPKMHHSQRQFGETMTVIPAFSWDKNKLIRFLDSMRGTGTRHVCNPDIPFT